ncbi:DUF6087 family protein [Streptomyces misionensis]|uniref:DUF6087 family protein n=1 Tax=Streptomyces misionensis TaxID=67331 RepID=UPI003401B45C
MQRANDGDPLAAYHKRRRPPLDVWRRHRPLHGGGHLRPDEARALEEWDGFAYAPAGTAATLAEAQRWVNEQTPGAASGSVGGHGTSGSQ